MNEAVLLTVQDVATWSRKDAKTIARAASHGEIKGFKVGGEWRFKIDAIRAWAPEADVSVEQIFDAAAALKARA